MRVAVVVTGVVTAVAVGIGSTDAWIAAVIAWAWLWFIASD